MADTPTREAAIDADTMQAEEPISDILCVCEALGQVYFLMIVYYAGEDATAAGYLFRRRVGSGDAAENILATNDTLRTLWCSPSGHLWTSSTTGLVWTTAPVPWPTTATEPGLEYEVPEGGLVWRHTSLPRQAHNDLPPNSQEIWGTSDDDLYITSHGGVIYHWNGSAWSQYFSGVGEPIGIRGRAPDDIYAAGYTSTILHFDGARWRTIADPDGSAGALCGVAFADDGDVYICGERGGRLLRGNARGFSVVGRYDAPFIGMANRNGRLIFAARQSGVVELAEQGLVVLRDDIIPWSVAEGEKHLYFTETPGRPAYSELDLTNGHWRRLSHVEVLDSHGRADAISR